MSRLRVIICAAFCLCAGASAAQTTAGDAAASFIFNGARIEISRETPDVARFAIQFATASDRCETPCIVPMTVAAGVETVGETDVLDFLMTEVADNTGLMVDARTPEDRARGFIPGTVNLPFATMAPENEFRVEILKALGARELDGVFNFSDARTLLVYDTGPSTDDAGRLVGNLIDAGYPVQKIRYYRGGMQVWSVLGFSVEEPIT